MKKWPILYTLGFICLCFISLSDRAWAAFLSGPIGTGFKTYKYTLTTPQGNEVTCTAYTDEQTISRMNQSNPTFKMSYTYPNGYISTDIVSSSGEKLPCKLDESDKATADKISQEMQQLEQPFKDCLDTAQKAIYKVVDEFAKKVSEELVKRGFREFKNVHTLAEYEAVVDKMKQNKTYRYARYQQVSKQVYNSPALKNYLKNQVIPALTKIAQDFANCYLGLMSSLFTVKMDKICYIPNASPPPSPPAPISQPGCVDLAP